MIRIIEGQRWYQFLSSGRTSLLQNRVITDTNLIISLSLENTRIYTYFNSYIDFAKYQSKFPIEKCSFHEVILGHNYQKPRFDIDLEEVTLEEAEHIKDQLIDAVINVFDKNGINLDLRKDLILCTSHGEMKKSYHIIINNWCHSNNKDAKGFYNKVMNELTMEKKDNIDCSVYSSKQQFRIIGSQKVGSKRPKVFQERWFYKRQEIIYQYSETPENEFHKIILQLEASLLSVTQHCNLLPIFTDQIPRLSCINSINEQTAINALKLCAKFAGLSEDSPKFPYRLQSVKGGIIILKRLLSSKCKICERIHEHENPYLIVVGDEQSVYFCCRRSEKKLFLGKLNPNNNWISKVFDKAFSEISNS